MSIAIDIRHCDISTTFRVMPTLSDILEYRYCWLRPSTMTVRLLDFDLWCSCLDGDARAVRISPAPWCFYAGVFLRPDSLPAGLPMPICAFRTLYLDDNMEHDVMCDKHPFTYLLDVTQCCPVMTNGTGLYKPIDDSYSAFDTLMLIPMLLLPVIRIRYLDDTEQCWLPMEEECFCSTNACW